ncbi:MAG: LysE family transporter [Pseudohongiellaceae bacterium]
MYLTEFVTIAVAHLVAVVAPGPDFAIVFKQTVVRGRQAGLWTSAGVGTGILVHVAYSVLGVGVLLSQSGGFFVVAKFVAAGYLAWLGVIALKSSMGRDMVDVQSETETAYSRKMAFTIGFFTNGLNPKATLFFVALYAVVISADTPITVQILYGLYLAFATFSWFALLSWVLGKDDIRRYLLRAGPWFERAMGVVFLAIAVRLLFFT